MLNAYRMVAPPLDINMDWVWRGQDKNIFLLSLLIYFLIIIFICIKFKQLILRSIGIHPCILHRNLSKGLTHGQLYPLDMSGVYNLSAGVLAESPAA